MRQGKWEVCHESVGDSDKFSRPFALLTENVVHELKLRCQIRSGAGHGGTFYCNEMWKGDVWRLIWVLGIYTLTGVMSHQLAPVLGSQASSRPQVQLQRHFLVPFPHPEGTPCSVTSGISFPRGPWIPCTTAHAGCPKATGRIDFSCPLAASRILLTYHSLVMHSSQQS